MARHQLAPNDVTGVSAGERWETGRGDGAGLYVVGNPKRRVKIGDFALGGRAGGSATCHERALLAAQAPLMYEALLDVIASSRETGFFQGEPENPVHRVGCECGLCQGVRALALAEGGGRCILCGCTEYDACDVGCAWVDEAQLLCTAHPAKTIKAAKALIAKELT